MVKNLKFGQHTTLSLLRASIQIRKTNSTKQVNKYMINE